MKKQLTRFRPQIRSRHPSHSCLRDNLPLLPVRSIVRLGSTTIVEDGRKRVEINSIEAVRNSANKLRMKQCFLSNNVKSADWYTYNEDMGIFVEQQTENGTTMEELPYPIVAKHIYGSRGRGNTLINNREELGRWMENKQLSNYIFEKFYNYSREYRLHVTKDGCFYTCRKMLRSDTPDNNRWFRNDSNSVWVLEDNPMFDKPVNWDEVVEQSVLALSSVGLDIGAVDLRIQSARKGDRLRERCEFIVVEINSAPSFGDITASKYIEMLPKLILEKHVQ
jgi:D-alanine-D-alanine ligase-like ATP-grasp enzyme